MLLLLLIDAIPQVVIVRHLYISSPRHIMDNQRQIRLINQMQPRNERLLWDYYAKTGERHLLDGSISDTLLRTMRKYCISLLRQSSCPWMAKWWIPAASFTLQIVRDNMWRLELFMPLLLLLMMLLPWAVECLLRMVYHHASSTIFFQ